MNAKFSGKCFAEKRKQTKTTEIVPTIKNRIEQRFERGNDGEIGLGTFRSRWIAQDPRIALGQSIKTQPTVRLTIDRRSHHIV